MEIYVNQKPFIEAKLNSKTFLAEFTISNNLKESFLKEVKINTSREDVTGKEGEYLYLGIDWGTFFKALEIVSDSIVSIKAYECKIVGGINYKPKTISTQTGIIELEENRYDKVDYIVTDSLSPRFDKHIEFMLASNLVDFVNYKWNFVVDMG